MVLPRFVAATIGISLAFRLSRNTRGRYESCKLHPLRSHSHITFRQNAGILPVDISAFKCTRQSDGLGQKRSALGFAFKSRFDSAVLTYNGKVVALTYNQYKELAPREYFKTVKTGITIPYTKTGKGVDDKSLIWIDDDQECYYQKVSYNDYTDPTEQYYGSSVGLPQNVCYVVNNGQGSISVNSSTNKCSTAAGSLKKKTDYNNTSQNVYSDYREGYCLEYDYSKEIYYTGSGKFNCITWIPGYIK